MLLLLLAAVIAVVVLGVIARGIGNAADGINALTAKLKQIDAVLIAKLEKRKLK